MSDIDQMWVQITISPEHLKGLNVATEKINDMGGAIRAMGEGLSAVTAPLVMWRSPGFRAALEWALNEERRRFEEETAAWVALHPIPDNFKIPRYWYPRRRRTTKRKGIAP